MSAEPTKFPSPIGGVPDRRDLAPSIVFLVAYAVTVPLAVYRLTSRSSRNALIVATAITIGEHVLDFSFRIAMSSVPQMQAANFWISWLQSSYAMDYIGIAGDISNIARIFLLNSTRGNHPTPSSQPYRVFKLLGPLSRAQKHEEPVREKPFAEALVDPEPAGGTVLNPPDIVIDEPGRRLWVERFGLVTLALRMTAFVLAAVYSGYYFNGTSDYDDALIAQYLRYASTILMTVYQLLTMAILLWATYTRPDRVARWPALYLVGLAALLTVPTVYRLVAMANYTDALLSTAPGSLNSSGAKALFYVLHILPEWIAGTLLVSVNVKGIYGLDMSVSEALYG